MSDEFLARIRAAAIEAPAIPVDRGRVLRTGRRRRVARAVGGVGLTGLLLAGTVTAVASLAPSDPQTPVGQSPDATDVPYDQPYGPVEVVTGVAEIDLDTGVIQLPLDEYGLTAAELDLVGTAQDVFLDGCFEEAGYGEYYRPGEALVDSPAWHARESERYGVWRATDVRDHGYAGVMALWGPPEDRPSAGLPFSEEMATASRGCYRAMLDSGLSYEPETATAAAPLGAPLVFETEEAAPVIHEWTTCLEVNGVAAPREADSVLVPTDVWNASFDEQVRIGLVDAACKAEVDLVQRLGDVEAAYQLEYIERGREWVEEFAALQERMLRAAEAYLEQAVPEGATD